MCSPKIPKKAPFVLEVTPGKYAWCTCGESKSQPYCDGSHKGTGFSPNIEEVTETKIVAWCGCKHSKNGSFCDGSHASM